MIGFRGFGVQTDAIIHSLKLKEALGKDYYLARPEVMMCASAPARPY